MRSCSNADDILIATAPSPYPFQRLSRSGNFAAGIVSGMLARTLSSPFDVVKVLVQVAEDGKSLGQSVQDLYKRGGLRAFWTGNTVSILNQGYYSGVKFFIIKELKTLMGNKKNWTGAESAFTGAVAGVIAQAALYPMDLVRTRMIVYPGKYDSLWQATKRIVTEEGILSLWTGLKPTVIGSIPYEGSNYFIYDIFRQLYIRKTGTKTISPKTNAVLGTAAGMASQAVAYPFEVVRRLMMLTNPDGSKMHSSMRACFKKVYKEEGIAGFFKGIGLNTIKVIPFSALQYTLYDETCKSFAYLRSMYQHGQYRK